MFILEIDRIYSFQSLSNFTTYKGHQVDWNFMKFHKIPDTRINWFTPLSITLEDCDINLIFIIWDVHLIVFFRLYPWDIKPHISAYYS